MYIYIYICKYLGIDTSLKEPRKRVLKNKPSSKQATENPFPLGLQKQAFEFAPISSTGTRPTRGAKGTSKEGGYGGFLKWWYPTTIGFPTKNDHFGVFWGYHHLRKHPYECGTLGMVPLIINPIYYTSYIVGIYWIYPPLKGSLGI